MHIQYYISVILTVVNQVAAESEIFAEYMDESSTEYYGSVDSKCGGMLDAPSGRISYKATEAFLPNERCIWILRVPKASGYSVTLQTAGFLLSDEVYDHQVILKGFGGKEQYWYNTIALKSVDAYELPGQQLLTITFHSGNNNNNSYHGFILNYTAQFDCHITTISTASVDIMHNSGSGIIRHPRTGNIYVNDTSTFIFKPTNNIDDPERSLVVSYILNVDSSGCKGNCRCLYVYKFRHAPPNSDKWGYPTLLCSREESELFEHSDVIMMVFFTRAEVDNASFHLTYFISNNNNMLGAPGDYAY